MPETIKALFHPTYLLPRVFFLSGIASLFFQVAWQRLLTVYYGSGPVSITLIVSIYMLGLGLGALIGGTVADRAKNKLVAYMSVEFSLGIFGLASLPFLGFLGRSTAGSEPWMCFVFMSLFLCIPTMLMGMTLPLVIKIFNFGDHNFLNSVSRLYYVNTIGAAVGCLTAAYVVISFFGLDRLIYAASGIEFLLSLLIFISARVWGTSGVAALVGTSAAGTASAGTTGAETTPAATADGETSDAEMTPAATADGETSDAETTSVANADGETSGAQSVVDGTPSVGPAAPTGTTSSTSWRSNQVAVLALVCVSGFLAIAYEIIWFRFLQVLVKSSPYSFATILFIYLVGIGLGSNLCQRFARRLNNDKTDLFFGLQALIGLYSLISIVAYYYLTRETDFKLLTVMSFSHYTAWPVKPWVEVPPYFGPLSLFLWPCLFMLIPTLAMGATFPLMTSLSLRKENREGNAVGTTYFFNTLGNMIGGIVTGFVLLPLIGTEMTFLYLGLVGISMALLISVKRFSLIRKGVLVVVTALLVVAFPARGHLWDMIHLTLLPASERDKWVYMRAEGIDSVVFTMTNSNVIQHYINGYSHGTRPDLKYYLEALEASAYAKNKDKVLVIGYGSGTILELALKMKKAKEITVVEICPTSVQNLRRFPFLDAELANERVKLVLDDGRRMLLAEKTKYDLIMMDPLRTSESNSNNVYSKQFFEVLKEHLNDEGVVLVWLDEHQVLPKTVASVFPFVRQYNFFCLASNKPFTEVDGERASLFAAFDKEMQQKVEEHKPVFVRDEKGIANDLSGYPVNEDWRPHCEYWLGRLFFSAGK